MQLAITLLVEIAIINIIFINISRIKFKKHEMLIFISVMWVIPFIIIYIGFEALGLPTIAINIIFVFIMAFTANSKIKNLPLSILYALSANLVFLLAGYISGTVMSFLIDPIRMRELIISNWLLYIASTTMFFPISYFLSRWLGIFIDKKLKIFTDALKRKFALYIIFGATITLALFFTTLFLSG